MTLCKESKISEEYHWIMCPVCNNKTRNKIREDTVLINFPLYCPKCKQETLINLRQFYISVIKEPDAQTQSR
ncbi:cysteine-rich KTR domain-containing protein [Massilimaliae timonensis]|uniref:Cysteine-rich KTR domain-containing protein n=1 Tax=Massiliimalia timonensis TaxID=1987501 RepID=A0A8J6P9D5_9FIRM|nr:cysteine-rich KTR domain-containing protein [Massiliimalia timonensis]MBC8611729.1 cysteine-rich KTR domain-containing protein [Massiliimalia timonensis]